MKSVLPIIVPRHEPKFYNGMRVLAISGDRSKRGVLHVGSPAFKRQEAYAKQFGNLDVIVFSRRSDGTKGVEVGALRVYPTNSTSRFFYGFDAIRTALRLPKPDIVTVQDPFETGLVAWLITALRRVPLHVQIHTDFLSPAYAELSFVNRMRVRIAKLVLKRASGIRVVSGRIKASLEGANWRLVRSVSVLPIFVDVDGVRGAPDASITSRFGSFRTRALVVSRLEPEKNVSLAIQAFAEAAPEDSCLIIVGTGSEAPSLQHFAKRLNVAGRVFFEGNKDAPDYYRFCDLVLVPSKYEGYGLVTVEALAAGKPVLSTDVGIAREAGAIVTSEQNFTTDLKKWFESGPRTGELKNYPYANFEEYVHAYCNDIMACTNGKKLP